MKQHQQQCNKFVFNFFFNYLVEHKRAKKKKRAAPVHIVNAISDKPMKDIARTPSNKGRTDYSRTNFNGKAKSKQIVHPKPIYVIFVRDHHYTFHRRNFSVPLFSNIMPAYNLPKCLVRGLHCQMNLLL